MYILIFFFLATALDNSCEAIKNTCSTGGTVTKSRIPPGLKNPCAYKKYGRFAKGTSIPLGIQRRCANSGAKKDIVSRFDYCRTPTSTSLIFKGDKVEFNCMPNLSETPEANYFSSNSPSRHMLLCDPFLYGFIGIEDYRDVNLCKESDERKAKKAKAGLPLCFQPNAFEGSIDSELHRLNKYCEFKMKTVVGSIGKNSRGEAYRQSDMDQFLARMIADASSNERTFFSNLEKMLQHCRCASRGELDISTDESQFSCTDALRRYFSVTKAYCSIGGKKTATYCKTLDDIRNVLSRLREKNAPKTNPTKGTT